MSRPAGQVPAPGRAGRTGRTGWWQCVAVAAHDRPVLLALVDSREHGDGERVRLPEADARAVIADRAVAVARFDDTGYRVVSLLPGPRGAIAAPPLWFVEVAETSATPPAVNLVAFSATGQRSGQLVAAEDLQSTDVGDQVGAVRWYPVSGEVDQVYVQPQWRRRSVSLALLTAAAVLSHARDWPRLWGDGQRTALGESMRASAAWRERAAPLTHLAPPMSPGDAGS